MTTSVCRFCLEDTWGETLYPCRCKAPVHRSCLDSWRAAGMNPANMTRCEVCHYHYRFVEGTRTWHIHLLLYSFFVCFNCVKGFANLCPCGGNQCETLLSHVKLIKHEQMKKKYKMNCIPLFPSRFHRFTEQATAVDQPRYCIASDHCLFWPCHRLRASGQGIQHR